MKPRTLFIVETSHDFFVYGDQSAASECLQEELKTDESSQILVVQEINYLKKQLEWPGNNLAVLKDEDKIMHDHLCELLDQRRYSTAEVCTASVGIWGALVVMRKKMDLIILESDAKSTRIQDLNEQIDNLQEIVGEFNNKVKEIKDLKAQMLKMEAAYANKET